MKHIQVALAAGDAELAISYLREIDPATLSEGDRNLALLLAFEAGDPELAARFGEFETFLPDDPATQTPDAEDHDDALEGLLDTRPEDVQLAQIERFLRFFGGRRDLYSVQWFDERRKRSGYRPVFAPLTTHVVKRHLLGALTLGQYLLFPDETCSFGVIDVDLVPEARMDSSLASKAGEKRSGVSHPAILRTAKRLVLAANRLGLSLFLEDSGSKGLHAWFFPPERLPAKTIRIVLSQLVLAAGVLPAEVSIEIFPKQERVGPKGLSSLVKLPLGFHQVTGLPCPLLDSELNPLSLEQALAMLQETPLATIRAIAGRSLVVLPAPSQHAPSDLPELPVPTQTLPFGEALRAIAVEDEPACAEGMLSRCAALKFLVDKAYSGKGLLPAEGRAIAWTLGLLGKDPQTARKALLAAGFALTALDQAQRGTPSPTGCKKLQGFAPCHGCPQDFSPYPTPLCFALEHQPTAKPHVFAKHLAGVTLTEDPVISLTQRLTELEAQLASKPPTT